MEEELEKVGGCEPEVELCRVMHVGCSYNGAFQFIARLWCLVYQVYKEGRAEPEFRKIEALHQRCLNAERMKDEASLTLQSTQNKLKKLEME